MWKGKKNTLKTLNPPQNCYKAKSRRSGQKKRNATKKKKSNFRQTEYTIINAPNI